MRKFIAVAATGLAVLGWSAAAIANPAPHPTEAPHDDHHGGEHKDGEHKDGEHKDGHHEEHKDGHHDESHKPAH